MSKFIYVLCLSLCAVAVGCADVPDSPDPEGVAVSYLDSNGVARGQMHLRLSVLDRYFTPFVDLATARVYVRQNQGNSGSTLSIIEPGSDPTGECNYFRASTGATAITLVIDRSHLGGEEAARQILRGAIEAVESSDVAVEFAVVNVGATVAVDQAMTSDRDAIYEAIRGRSVEAGDLALLKGIDAAVEETEKWVESASTRRAVVVITGALDTVSGPSFTYDSVASKALEAGVPVFVIGYGDGGFPIPEASEIDGLWTVAGQSGGRYIPGADPLYADAIVPAIVDSVYHSFEACVDAMALPDGSDYATIENLTRVSVAIESGGGELETVRTF